VYDDASTWPKAVKPTADEPLMNCDDKWHRGHCWYPFATVLFPARNVSLHYHFKEQYSDSMLDALTRHYTPQQGDVLAVSVGVHYHDNVAAFKTGMHSLLRWMQRTRYPGHLFLREYSHSHFDYSEAKAKQLDASDTDASSVVAGAFRRDIDPSKAKCSPLDTSMGARFQHTALQKLLKQCRTGRLSGGGDDDVDNDDDDGNGDAKRNDKYRCANVRYTPIHDASLQQWDAHFGMFGRKHGAKTNVSDCTHWCLPGGPVDHWSRIFFNQMLELPRLH
jgi:hypothetical protein